MDLEAHVMQALGREDGVARQTGLLPLDHLQVISINLHPPLRSPTLISGEHLWRLIHSFTLFPRHQHSCVYH